MEPADEFFLEGMRLLKGARQIEHQAARVTDLEAQAKLYGMAARYRRRALYGFEPIGGVPGPVKEGF
jgi:hypothetical protein